MIERENYVAAATFKEWMQHHLDTEDLRCLSEYGAQTGVPGLIYYRETLALYEAFTEEIEEIAQQYGGLGKIAIRSDAYGITQLINALVWTAAEHHARALQTLPNRKGARHAD